MPSLPKKLPFLLRFQTEIEKVILIIVCLVFLSTIQNYLKRCDSERCDLERCYSKMLLKKSIVSFSAVIKVSTSAGVL